MRRQTRTLWGICLFLVISAKLLSADMVDSFENGVPKYWKGPKADSLSVSSAHYKHGTRSLQWKWNKGDVLTVKHGIGDVHRVGGYGGSYSKATFGVWVWNRVPITSKVTFQFCEGDTVTGWFEFPLDFQGWRRAHLRYNGKSQFEGNVSSAVDTLKILAPTNSGEGTLFLDAVVYNGIMDYRNQCVPGADAWTPFTPDADLFPLADTLTLEQAFAVRTVYERVLKRYVKGGGIDDARFAKVMVQSAALGIVRKDSGISGEPVVKDVGYYKEAGLHELSDPNKIGGLMLSLAKAFHDAENPPRRTALATMFMDLNDHLRDQGLVAGSGFPFGWYGGRNMATATFLMQDILRKRKRLNQAAAFFDYSYGASAIFDDASINPSMDYFHIDAGYRLLGALMQPTPEKQYQWLKAYGRHLSKAILFEGSNGYKPDGSAFHHGFHYMAYAGYTSRSMAGHVKALANTPFAISQEAFDRLKLVLLNMRFFSNTVDVPLSMHGRHPFTPHKIPSDCFLRFAACLPEPDSALTCAFLRLHPNETLDEFKAEPNPQGNLSMPYAGLMAHRRSDWLVTVKGYGKYVSHGESYADSNRFGRYLSNGYLDVLLPGGRAASGCVAKGWDFNRLDGTTVIYLSDDELRVPHKGTEMLRTNQACIGGVSHLGQNGAFVMHLEGAKRHNSTLRATKTYFFFDDRVICLGSDIQSDDSTHPTHTNLFQKALDPAHTAIAIDGETVTATIIKKVLDPKKAHLLVDTIGTGYYLPKGQKITVARKLQKHRDQQDRRDYEGHFASAWIDHENAPKNATYEYVLLVGMDKVKMDDFFDKTKSDNPPYTIFQKNEHAHIVYDAELNAWGGAFLHAQPVDLEEKGLPVVAVGGPCLMMTSYTKINELTVSLADPNLRLKRIGAHGLESQPETMTISIGLDWTFVRIPKDAITTENTIEIQCRNGESHAFTIKKRAKE